MNTIPNINIKKNICLSFEEIDILRTETQSRMLKVGLWGYIISSFPGRIKSYFKSSPEEKLIARG